MELPEIKEAVITYRISRLLAAWQFPSKVLGRIVRVPRGFVYDHESVPVIQGTSKRGGLVHDYLSRKDSAPVVSKLTAAKVYREIMTIQGNAWWRKWLKSSVVICWPGYFHKHTVFETYEEYTGKEEDDD